jgi:hypothetical protein
MIQLWFPAPRNPGASPKAGHAVYRARVRHRVKSKQTNFARMSSAKRWAVLLCLLLAGMAIIAQAFHLHSNELAPDAKHCTICQVAHAPAQVATVAHVALGLTTTAFFRFSEDLSPKPILASVSLFSRPPPLV